MKLLNNSIIPWALNRVPGGNKLSRYIRQLDGETQYGELAEPIVFGAGEDFEIELIAYVGTLGNKKFMDGEDSSSSRFDFALNAGGIAPRPYFSHTVNGQATDTVVENAVNFIRLKRDLSTSDQGSKIIKWLTVSHYLNTGFNDCSVLDLKIWHNGTSETGQLTHYKLDKDKSYELAEGEELGEELYQISDIALGSGWSVEDTDLVYSGVGTDLVTINTSLVVGDHYEIIVRASSGTFRERYDRVNFVGGTESRRVLSYTGGTLQLQGNNEPCRISLISTKQLPPSTLIWRNNPPAVKITQDKVSGDWLGKEIVDPELMEATNTGTSTTTYVNKIGHIQTEGDYTSVRQEDALVVGQKYRAVFDVVDYVSGQGLILGEGADEGRGVYISGNGRYVVDFVAESHSLQFKRWTGATDMKLLNISTKPLLSLSPYLAAKHKEQLLMAQWEREKYQDRYITKFDGENTYIKLPEPIVFETTDDVRIEIEASAGQSSNQYLLDDSAGVERLYAYLQTNNYVGVGAGLSCSVHGGDHLFERDRSIRSLIISGKPNNRVKFDIIGKRYALGEHWNGRIPSIKVWKNDVLVFATHLNHPTLCINEIGLGDELIEGDPLFAGAATLNGNVITATSNTWGYIAWDISTEVGETYLIRMNVNAGQKRWTSKVWSVPSYSGLHSEHRDVGESEVEILFTATSSETRIGAQFLGPEVGDTLEVTSISMVHAPGSSEIINPEADPSLFSYNSSTDPDQWQTSDQSVVIPIAQPQVN